MVFAARCLPSTARVAVEVLELKEKQMIAIRKMSIVIQSMTKKKNGSMLSSLGIIADWIRLILS